MTTGRINQVAFLCDAGTACVHCIVARVLWDLVLGLVGVKWVFPNTVKEVLYGWGGGGLNILLYVIFGIGLNCIWKRSRIPF